MEENFSTRLQKAMHLRNIKASELSEKANIPKSAISQYLSGLYEAKQKTIFKLANVLNVSEAWLMGLNVPMEKESIEIENKNNSLTIDMAVKIPIVGRISAGLPILAVENIEGYEFAPASKIKKGFDYFYLRVQGDSMNLKFSDGDIVLVQKQDTLENDEIGVILVNGDDATVKKYKSENGLVILEPMSSNPEHAVQIYNPQKISIRIIGKVISYQGDV
ncbi:MAG: LexA family protein [Clostridia bacterium]